MAIGSRYAALKAALGQGSKIWLELSPLVYDEVERKLLAGGYGHLFEHGPGSRIDMTGIEVTREQEALPRD